MRNYRIVRIAGIHYPKAVESIYNKNPELQIKTYSDQQAAVFDNAYIYSNSFSKGMRSLGHEAFEIIYDLEHLQKTWAKEKGIKYSSAHWQQEILLAQIKHIRPDVVYFQDIYSLPFSARKQLKVLFPFIKIVAIFRGFPGGRPDVLCKEFEGADALFFGSPILVEKCASRGIRSHLIYHSFDEAILDKVQKDPTVAEGEKYDFTFLGTSGHSDELAHQSRYWYLFELIKRTDLMLWIDEKTGVQKGTSAKLKKIIRGLLRKILLNINDATLRNLSASKLIPDKGKKVIQEVISLKRNALRIPAGPLSEMFPDRCSPPVFGIELYKIMLRSKVTFNKHSDDARDTIDNMRLFQATGIGTCLLTDDGRNMKDLFEPDYEVVTYSSIDECVEKVKFLLENDETRRQIALAGQKRTLRNHTTIKRCRQINDILQERLRNV